MNFDQFANKYKNIGLNEHLLRQRYRMFKEEQEMMEQRQRMMEAFLQQQNTENTENTETQTAVQTTPAVAVASGSGAGGTPRGAGVFITDTAQGDGSFTVTVETTTGYARADWWDGTFSFDGDGTSNDIYLHKDYEIGTNTYAVYSCNSTGEIDGDLIYFSVSSPWVTDANVRGCAKMEALEIENSSLSTMDISNMESLQYAWLDGNMLTEILLTGSPSIATLNAANNMLESIDLAGMTGYLGKAYIGLSNNNLGAAALNAAYASLGFAGGFKNNIDVYSNPGVHSDNKAIAAEKGWQVNGTSDDSNIQVRSDRTDGTIGGTVETSTGYVYVEWWDGTFEVLGDGTAFADIAWTKPADGMPDKFIALFACDEFGVASGYIFALACPDSGISAIDVERVYGLEVLDCSDNPIKYLSVYSCNAISEMNISGCALLEYVSLPNCGISGIPQEILTANLMYLDLSYNLIGDVDFTACDNLHTIILRGCSMLDATMPSSTNLQYVEMADNTLSILDLSGCPNVRFVDVHNNDLTELNLTNNVGLELLFVGGNQLSALSLTGLQRLHGVAVDENHLTSLSITDCPIFEWLDMSGMYTDLTAFNLTNCPMLDSVYAQNTSLSNGITLSNVPTMSWVYLYNCNMDETAIDSTLTGLPDRTSLYTGWIHIGGNPGTAYANVSIGTDKNWSVAE